MSFDVEKARKAGYGDAEIAGFLASQSKYDIDQARQAGYSDAEIITHLAGDARKAEMRNIASPGNRVAMGMTDQIHGGAQLLTNVLPTGVVNAVNSATQYVNELPVIGPVTKAIGMTPATPEQIDAGIRTRERDLDAARRANMPQTLSTLVTGEQQPGIDWWRLGGNVVSPVNIVGAGLTAATNVGRAAVGAGMGLFGGATQPVVVEQDKPYLGQKTAQMGLGAAAGAVATPILGKFADAVTTRINNAVQKGARAAAAPQQADEMIVEALREIGQKIDDFPPDALAKIRKTVTDSLVAGKELDAAQLARMADFERLGMKPLAGQVTRDPAQWSNEYNLARSGEVGKPIAQRLIGQNQQLTEQIGSFGARDAGDALGAGLKVTGALQEFDKRAGAAVGKAYDAARASTGVDQGIPLQGLAQDFETVRRKFGEQNIPSAVRGILDEFGIVSGKQTKIFTPRDAEEVLQVINANADPAKKAEYAALGALRNAVKRTVEEAPTGDAFGGARKAAAARFKLLDAVPAIQAAADGSVSPDAFVQKFVISNKDSKQVIDLAKVLSRQSPEALDEARNQVGAHLFRSAFGENLAGDAPFSPERFAKVLRDIGDAKLSAFYTPAQIADLKALARVGAYINKLPAVSSANTSNSANRALDMVQQIPGLNLALNTMGPVATASARGLNALISAATRGKQVQQAINPTVQATEAALPPAAAQLRDLLSGSLAAGSAATVAGTTFGRDTR